MIAIQSYQITVIIGFLAGEKVRERERERAT